MIYSCKRGSKKKIARFSSKNSLRRVNLIKIELNETARKAISSENSSFEQNVRNFKNKSKDLYAYLIEFNNYDEFQDKEIPFELWQCIMSCLKAQYKRYFKLIVKKQRKLRTTKGSIFGNFKRQEV